MTMATVAVTTATSATTATAATEAPAAPSAPSAPAATAATAAASATTTAAPAPVDYGAWQRDVAAVIAQARPYIEQRTSSPAGQSPAGERMAIVLDIDNTSLETDFHYFWEYPTPAVGPVRDLARYADSRGVDVFFVTARPGILHAPTSYNLTRAGYPVDGLYVRDLPDLFDEVSAYKTAKRGEIEAKGYTIIANIGNRATDLVGGHAEKTFKLPDYDGRLS
ncbi:HAD family acid phosphatase [Streptomyces ficellus]|uniref:HAD family acid phosphatase n=2 Tax=Streptomyces ficellus TaxID=1977088 RepID=A0ABT7Z1B9_9ACTN|nr:HAD family acid phosphatase [Streptomyces ficellus]MDN3293295.1 HAD family acid phosphatase [Streptomyces ficellus]